jgi:hypothetical protein
MTLYDPKAFGKRLQEALEQRGWDVMTLKRKVYTETGGARGTSWASIYSYVRGVGSEGGPRLEVVEALGALLNRLPEYLMYGKGPMTQAQKQAQERGEIGPWQERYDAIRAGMERTSPFWDMAAYFYATEPLIAGLVIDLLESGGEELVTWSAEDVELVTVAVVNLISLPAVSLSTGDWLGESPVSRKWPEYLAAMTMAIRAVLPERGNGRPEEFVSRLRTQRSKKSAHAKKQ